MSAYSGHDPDRTPAIAALPTPKGRYRTAPAVSSEMPPGVPYIVGNEGAERFSYYGMKAFLVVFMTQYMLNSAGVADFMTKEEATAWFHTFGTAVYFLPLLGALLADVFLGKYMTIMLLSLVYCAGHAALFVDQTRTGLAIGLTLIAIGSGGIKPCVSAHVGDQFGKSNAHLLKTVMNYFYMAINLGAGISIFATPWLLENYGPHVAFGTPGALMFVATIVFWMGRHKFVHIPPGGKKFVREAFSGIGLKAILKLAPIYAFVAIFWALFDQTGSTWVLQSDKLDRNFLGFEWLSSQIQAINPVMILTFVPLVAGFKLKSFEWEGIYAKIDRVWSLTPLRKIGIGFFLAVPSFLIPAWLENQVAAGELPSIAWQVLAYVLLTFSEILISITCLEFSYTQAPKTMKSLIMALFLLSVSLGNAVTAGVNFFIQNDPPSFKPDATGEYLVELTADDGTEKVMSTTLVTVVDQLEPPNKEVKEKKREPPTANAGRTMAVKPGAQIRLYGTAEKGDSKGGFEYGWKLVKWPYRRAIPVYDADTRNPTLTPEAEGEYVLQFQVKVGEDTAVSEVTIICTHANLPPLVNAGPPQKIELGNPVVLDGSASYDPNGDKLTYSWRIDKAPAESGLNEASISNNTLPGATTKLEGASYYNFFAILMFVAAVLFIPLAMWYREETHLQDEEAGA